MTRTLLGTPIGRGNVFSNSITEEAVRSRRGEFDARHPRGFGAIKTGRSEETSQFRMAIHALGGGNVVSTTFAIDSLLRLPSSSVEGWGSVHAHGDNMGNVPSASRAVGGMSGGHEG